MWSHHFNDERNLGKCCVSHSAHCASVPVIFYEYDDDDDDYDKVNHNDDDNDGKKEIIINTAVSSMLCLALCPLCIGTFDYDYDDDDYEKDNHYDNDNKSSSVLQYHQCCVSHCAQCASVPLSTYMSMTMTMHCNDDKKEIIISTEVSSTL